MMHTADIARIVLGAWAAGVAAGTFLVLGWKRPTARVALLTLLACFMVAASVSYVVTGPSIDEGILRLGRVVSAVAGLGLIVFAIWTIGEPRPARARMWLAAVPVLALQSLVWGLWEYLRVVSG
jgi:hypothetical protein